MRLGPAISFNPTEKLVITAHFQVSPTIELTGFEYDKSNPSGSAGETLTLVTEDILKNAGIKTNLGISVRWGVFGLSFDYISGGINYQYQYQNSQTGEGGNGSDDPPILSHKLKSSAFEIKLIL